MMKSKSRCIVCGKWYEADKRTKHIQKVCNDEACRKERKAGANRSWRARHPGYEKSRRLKKQAWTKQTPDYWKTYRREHPAYRIRDNNMRRTRHKRAKNAARQDAIREKSVERLQSIPRYEVETAARQDTMDRRVDAVVEYLLWKERAARQDDIEIAALNKP